jgi:replicative DNA helicase
LGDKTISVNAPQYAAIVREKARLRRLVYFGEQIRDLAFDGPSAERVVEAAISGALEIAGDLDGPVAPREWRAAAESAIQELKEQRQNPARGARFLFGIQDLDEMTSGLRRKELALIVAPTSNGKTLLAGQLCARGHHDGHSSLFFSAEMPGEQLALRETAYRARVPFYLVRRPERLSDEEFERLQGASADDLRIRIVDRDVTPARIWAMSEIEKRTRGLDFIVADYDQLIVEAGMDPADDESIFRHQRNFIIRAKKLAERLDVCFILLAQLRKISPRVANGSQPPRLDDIWGDSSMRNTPQVILWIEREFFRHNMEMEYERKANIYVLKARNDRTGVVAVEFDPEFVRFIDLPLAKQEATREGDL